MDLINRQAAVDAMTDKNITCNMDSVQDSVLHRIKRAVHRILAGLPSAQPDRKMGWWLIREGISDAQCSECEMYFRDVYDMDNSDAFCRHCGAKMEGLKYVQLEKR